MDLREVGCDAGDLIDLDQDNQRPGLFKDDNEAPGSLKSNQLILYKYFTL